MSDQETGVLADRRTAQADAIFQSVKVYVQRHVSHSISAVVTPALERLTVAEQKLAAPPPSLSADQIVDLVRELLDAELLPLTKRLAAAEKALADAPLPLTADDVAKITQQAIDAIDIVVPDGVPGPVGEPGPPGLPGKDGADGTPGIPGAAGVDGNDAVVDYDAITATVKELVEQSALEFGGKLADAIPDNVKAALDALPKPIDGRDGRDGYDGEPGLDGKDGFGLDDFEITITEEGLLELKFIHGDRVKVREVEVPWPVEHAIAAADHEYADRCTGALREELAALEMERRAETDAAVGDIRRDIADVHLAIGSIRNSASALSIADELLAKRIAAHAEAVEAGLGALESRLDGVEAAAVDSAAQRAVAAVSGAISEGRAELATRFADLQREAVAHLVSLKPAPGPAGRDAKMVAPVPYQSGTGYRYNDWVRHAGGLWHCYRDTDAAPDPNTECGWTLVVDGLAGVTLDSIPEDQRHYVVVVQRASGRDARMEFRVPSLIYRGQWREMTRFDEGDVISHDGSAWVAKRTCIGSKPGTDEAVDDWTLAVKRGKNGIAASAQRGIHWQGDYKAGKKYEVNDLVRTPHAIWICLRPTDDPPSNTNPMSWAKLLGDQ